MNKITAYNEKKVSKEDIINGILAKMFKEEMTEQAKEGYRFFQFYYSKKK